MDQTERIYKINTLLSSSGEVNISTFLKELEVSKATFKRDLAYMRDRLGAPIIWNRATGSYRCEDPNKGYMKYQLPGLWLNSSEIHALLVMEHLLENLQPGLLTPHVGPMRSSIRALIEKGNHAAEEVVDRIRLLTQASRDYDINSFEVISIGLLKRKRLRIDHYNRDRDELLQREVSPQRLVHYRDNWYLDTWCHLRDDLRTFSLETIKQADLLKVNAKKVSNKKLDGHFSGSYGIFSGPSDNIAILKFSPKRARWVDGETWHPQQKVKYDNEGYFIMEIPYRDDRELIMDILKYGPDIEVISPSALKNKIKLLHQEAYTRYTQKQTIN